MAVITSSPTQFGKLLDLQRESLANLTSIKSLIESGKMVADAELAIVRESQQSERESSKRSKETNEILKKGFKEMTDAQREEIKKSVEAASNITTFAEKLSNLKSSIGNAPGNIKAAYQSGDIGNAVLKKLNFFGLASKKIEERNFVQQQKALGSEKTDDELRADFKTRRSAGKELAAQDKKIEAFKKRYNVTDDQFKESNVGKEMLAQRDASIQKIAATDIRFGAAAAAPAQAALANEEEKQETARKEEEQTNILKVIADNTSGKATGKAPQAEGGAGGGIFDAIGSGLKSLGGGLGSLGSGMGKGIRGLLFGMAQGLAALANPATLLGLGALTVSLMGIGKALEMAAPAIAAFAPVLMTVAEVIGNVFVKAIEMIPEVVASIGKAIMGVVETISNSIIAIVDEVTLSIERLAKIDAGNLAAVGAALLAVGAGLAGFAGGNIAAGLSNMVNGLFSKISGQPTPIEQMEKMASLGVNLEKAGTGIKNLASGMKEFGSIDSKNIKAISELPIEKIAAMGAAFNNSASRVASASAENQGARDSRLTSVSGGTAVVNAPVTNKSSTTNVMQVPLRNQDPTVNRYLQKRFS